MILFYFVPCFCLMSEKKRFLAVILLTRYRIAMEEAGLCWEQPSIDFRIESESKEDLKFVQTGWVMDVHLSHQTSAKYKSDDGQLAGRNLDKKTV